MKNAFRIVKKELDKIFKFPRTIFTTLILPGLLLFSIYGFIGLGLKSVGTEPEEYKSIIYVINAPNSLNFAFSDDLDLDVDLINGFNDKISEYKQWLLDGTIDAIIYYDEDFDNLVNNQKIPSVEVFYDESATNSTEAANKAYSLIMMQQQILYEKLGINPNIFNLNTTNLQKEDKVNASILAMVLPMIIMSFIYANALGIGSDAIAGEKERGTLATLLMLPIKRSEIIIGKIISTSTLTVLSALSSFIGLVASLPFSKSMFAIEGNISYTFIDILCLVIILLLIALTASTILLITSTLAKSIKEASTMALPIYILAILSPFISMIIFDKPDKIMYFIPIFNTIIGLKEILSLNFDFMNFLFIFLSSISYIAIFIVVLVRLFKSERVLYAK